jgi:hypothetical protein
VPSLRESQRAFVADLLASPTVPRIDPGWIRAGAVAAQDRLEVYRNNFVQAFRHALALTYPVIERLVGAPYFDRLAHDYQVAHPSPSGDLHHAGEAFARFLETQFRDSEYAYFADVARLEWALEDARRATGVPHLDVNALAGIDAERHGEVLLRLHPAARVVHAQYPIAAIWRANQPDADGSGVRLDAGGETVLLRATENGVRMAALAGGEAAFMTAIAAGTQLEAALEAGLNADAEFDVASALSRGFEWRAFAA